MIGRSLLDSGRQRAKIVNRADPDDPVLDRLLDSRHQGEADSVAELGMRETQTGHFPQHDEAVHVPVGAPGRRKRQDGFHGDCWLWKKNRGAKSFEPRL